MTAEDLVTSSAQSFRPGPRLPLALPLREPPRGALWPPDVLDMSGLDVMRSFADHSLPDPPITRLTGLRPTEVGLGVLTAAMPASEWWQSGCGVFLAGTIAFVADLPLSGAVLTTGTGGSLVVSSQLSASFLRPATVASQNIVGRGRVIHNTRSLGLAEATVQDGQGRLIGHATSRCALVPADRGAPSPSLIENMPPDELPDPYLRAAEGDVLGQEFWDATPGLDAVRRIADGTIRPPVSLLFDWRGVDAREGEFTMAMPASRWLVNAFGVVFGGAIALFADVAMTLAVGSTVPEATAYSPLDLTVNFLRPAIPDGGELQSRARVVHRGRTIAVSTCEIVDAKGRLLARASESTLILPGRSWARPVTVEEEMVRDGG